MKMVMIAYNEAIDIELMEGLSEIGVKNYTKACGAFGSGEASGTHLGTDVWPGRNNILFTACEDKLSRDILDLVGRMRKSLGKEGIKAFVLGIEAQT